MQLHPLIASLLRLIFLVVLLPAAASAASLTLSKTSGPPTTAVVLTGSGFTASSIVDIYFDTQQVAFRVTSRSGAFTYSTKVPASALPGAHDFTVLPHVAGGKFAQKTFKVQTSQTNWRASATGRGWNKTENVLTSNSVRNMDLLWRAPMSTYSTPIVYGDLVIAVLQDGGLGAYSMKSGAMVYSLPFGTADANYQIAPVAGSGLVIYSGSSNKLYARKASDGSLVWKGNVPGYLGAPVISGNVVYVPSDGAADSGVYAFSLNCKTGGATCTPLWHAADGNTSSSYVPPGSLSVAYDKVYAQQYNMTYVYDVGCGSGGAVCAYTDKRTTATSSMLAVGANGMIYLASGGEVLGLEADCLNCTPLWSGTLPSGSYRGLAVTGDRVFAVTQDKLVAFQSGCESSPCNPEWTTTLSYSAYTPFVAGDLVYVSSPRLLSVFPVDCYTGCRARWHSTTNALFSTSNYAGVALVDGKMLVSNMNSIMAFGLPDSMSKARVAVKPSQLKPDPRFAEAERALVRSLAAKQL